MSSCWRFESDPQVIAEDCQGHKDRKVPGCLFHLFQPDFCMFSDFWKILWPSPTDYFGGDGLKSSPMMFQVEAPASQVVACMYLHVVLVPN